MKLGVIPRHNHPSFCPLPFERGSVLTTARRADQLEILRTQLLAANTRIEKYSAEFTAEELLAKRIVICTEVGRIDPFPEGPGGSGNHY